MERIVGVIPARFASSRLPGKMLRIVAGLPLVVRVYRAVAPCRLLHDLVVATDNNEILATCRAHGVPCVLTDPSHPSGTDRVWEVAQRRPGDIYVNIQGDEPLVTPEHVEELIRPLLSDSTVGVATLAIPIDRDTAHDPNLVKVVFDARGRAIYFSRFPIPYCRDPEGGDTCFKHLGFYAYRRGALELFHELPPGALEETERLEQLRLLEHGIPIHVGLAPSDTIGVDTEEDLRRVEEFLNRNAPDKAA